MVPVLQLRLWIGDRQRENWLAFSAKGILCSVPVTSTKNLLQQVDRFLQLLGAFPPMLVAWLKDFRFQETKTSFNVHRLPYSEADLLRLLLRPAA